MVVSLDIGNCVYDPKRNLLYSYDFKEILGTPSEERSVFYSRKSRYNPSKSNFNDSYLKSKISKDKTVRDVLDYRLTNNKL